MPAMCQTVSKERAWDWTYPKPCLLKLTGRARKRPLWWGGGRCRATLFLREVKGARQVKRRETEGLAVPQHAPPTTVCLCRRLRSSVHPAPGPGSHPRRPLLSLLRFSLSISLRPTSCGNIMLNLFLKPKKQTPHHLNPPPQKGKLTFKFVVVNWCVDLSLSQLLLIYIF